MKNRNMPLYYLLGTVLSIFIIEYFSHIFVTSLDADSFFYEYEMILDSFILSLFLLPILYRFIYKSLSIEISLSNSIQQLLDEKTESECDLKESERQYRLLFDDNPMPMCVYDLETFAFLAINDSAVQFYGYSKDEAKSMTLKDIHLPEDLPALYELIQKIPQGINKAGVWRHVKKDGTVVFVEVTTHAISFEGRPARLAMASDVTDKLKVEESLKESEERFRAAFDNAPIGMAIVGLNGSFIQVNNALADMLGYKKHQLAGKAVPDVTYPDDISKEMEYKKLIFSGEVSGYEIEKRYLHADGHIIWGRLSVSTVSDNEGHPAYLIGQLEDITERKNADEKLKSAHEALKSSEENLRTLFDSATDGIIILDMQGFIVDVNKTIYERLGYTKDEMLSMHIKELVLPEFAAIAANRMAQIQKEGHAIFESANLMKNGGSMPVEINSRLIDYKGQKVYFSVVRNITERKKTQEYLTKIMKQQQAILDNIPDIAWLKDTEGRFIAVNAPFGRACGMSPEDVAGKTDFDIWPKDLAEGYRADDKDVMESRARKSVEEQLGGKDGITSWIATTKTPIFNEKGEVIGTTGIARDITERKKTEALIYQSKQDWEDTFNSLTDMITVHDKNYDIIRANKAAEKILGLPLLEDMKGKCFKFYHGTDAPPSGCPSCECLKTGIAATFEIFEPHLNMFIEINSIPRFDKENQLVGLIHVVRDITEKRKTQDLIKTQLERLNVLRTIDMAISSSLDLRLTLDIILQQAVSQLHVDAASILTYNKFSQRLEHSSSIGFRDARIKKTSLRLGVGYAGKVAYEKRTIRVFDKNELTEEFSKSSLIKEEGFMAYAGVPLIAKGEIKGVFEVFHRSVLTPDHEWLDFVEALAGQAAIAIDNATLFGDLQKSNVELIMAYDSTIEGWARALDYRDKETEGHSRRVTDLTVRIAQEMMINEEEIINIRRGALLHDIGKLGVPDSILLKPGKLTDEEWVIMKNHPVIAYEILAPIIFLKEALDIPYCHHEKWDGTGYPRGLRGDQIPLSARIFAVVDVWDALRSDRPYRPAWSEDKTIEHIKSLSGTHFDPAVLELFIKAIY